MAEADHGDQELPRQTREQLDEVGNSSTPDERASYPRWQRMRAATWPGWITRDMGLLLAARMFMSASRAFAGVVVPIYLASIGYGGFTLGLLFTVVALASALLS